VATTKAPPTKADPPVAKRRTIDVAGVKVSVLAELASDQWPTVERIAQRATRVYVGHGEKNPDRAKAINAVEEFRPQLISPRTKAPYSKAELRPVTSAVLKELRRIERAAKREREKARRVLERDVARGAVKAARAKAKLEAKHPYAQLPRDAKPTKVASKDETRPILTGGLVRKLGRGQSARWVLQLTDTYRMMEMPLDVHGDAVVDGAFIPREALQAIEKSEGKAFRVGKEGLVQPVEITSEHVGVEPYIDTYQGVQRRERAVHARTTRPIGVAIAPSEYLRKPREAIRQFPAVEKIRVKAPAVSRTLRVTLNAQMLAELAAALPGKGGVVTLVLDTGDFDDKTKTGVRRQSRKPIRVAVPNVDEAIAIQMPVREGPNARS
jgi:hypothetical protein